MNFIFQAKPAIFDLRDRLKVHGENAWLASRYQREMHEGDTVYLWRAGDPSERGIYGRGTIVKPVFTDRKNVQRVVVRYDEVFPEHISVELLKKHPVLRDLLILRNAMGTNFPLTDEQDQALSEIIASEEERWERGRVIQ